MPSKGRSALFALLVVACVAAIAVAVVSAAREADPDDVSASAARALLTGAHDGRGQPVMVRDLRDGAHGRIAVATLGSSAPPAQAPLRCDRVYFAHRTGLCLAPGGGFASGYRARIFDADMRVRHELAVEGIPSRARVSPDGRYGSVTLFVTGHAYAEAGDFSTQTTLIDLRRGTKIADLERFTITDGDRQITAVDMNFWGVTFAADSDRFYATLATGGKTYLIEGSISKQAARVIHENVECPSLSPDGTRIAYKKRVDSDSGLWRLTVLDLETMRETPLAETRSVDDQAEWLGDDRVLYGIDRDVFVVAADGSGKPRRLVGAAGSPAVVRD